MQTHLSAVVLRACQRAHLPVHPVRVRTVELVHAQAVRQRLVEPQRRVAHLPARAPRKPCRHQHEAAA